MYLGSLIHEIIIDIIARGYARNTVPMPDVEEWTSSENTYKFPMGDVGNGGEG